MNLLNINIFQKIKALSLKQFGKYFFIGGVVGVITLIVREIIAFMLGKDNPGLYLLSILLAYTIGTIINYLLQRIFTFKINKSSFDWVTFLNFSLVSVLGAVVTSIFSFIYRYCLNFDYIFLNYSATIAFGMASITASVFTYSTNALFTFTKVYKNENCVVSSVISAKQKSEDL